MTESVISSLLDTDLYKFTMMQCVLHHFPKAEVLYRFFRRKPIVLRNCIPEIKEAIHTLCELKLTEDELQYLNSLPFIKPDFVDYLSNFKLNEKHIQIQDKDDFALIVTGPWVETILFEVPLLAIISEIYYKINFPQHDLTLARTRLAQKIQYTKDKAPDLKFTDFGTRRRFAKHWQEELIITLKEQLLNQFVGTSNVLFAKKHELAPIGTMAHEYLQACQVLAPSLLESQTFALNTWLLEYPDSLGIALTDTITMDVFLQSFDLKLANRYTGLRQDSGDPFIWGEKALAHYQKLGIDAKTKSLVFSDSLTFERMVKIQDYFKSRAKPFFGIGTNLTNDTGAPPLDIVIKMTQTNHQPVVKISDSPGKIICDDLHYLEQFKKVFQL